jgi:hypothetical protein
VPIDVLHALQYRPALVSSGLDSGAFAVLKTLDMLK